MGLIQSGALQWTQLAIGAVKPEHVASGYTLGGASALASGQVTLDHMASGFMDAVIAAMPPTVPSSGPAILETGSVSSGHLVSGFLPALMSSISGRLASGNVQSGHLASGFVNTLVQSISGRLDSGAVLLGHLASGLVSGLMLSGSVGSGQIASGHLASGLLANLGSQAAAASVAQLKISIPTAELISGTKAVAFAQGTYAIVRAERASGLRLPAIGITVSGGSSGEMVDVVCFGLVPSAASGMVASGWHGRLLFAGSGGLLVNSSGFNGGASSGVRALSGNLSQVIGFSVSGGVFVQPQLPVRSGFNHSLPWVV